MSAFIPPIHVTISGNRCGGCCKLSPTKEPAPLRYIVLAKSDGRLVGISPSRVREDKVPEATARVYAAVSARLEHLYAIHVDDLPLSLKPNVSKLPSVGDLRALEATVHGYAEGLKRGVRNSNSTNSPDAPIPHSDDSGEGK